MEEQLSTTQVMLTERLAEIAKLRCEEMMLECRAAKPKNFIAVVRRYYGRVQGMERELEKCVLWCATNRKKFFTPMRYYNWCETHVRINKEREQRNIERMKLRNGTEHQQRDYHRQFHD